MTPTITLIDQPTRNQRKAISTYLGHFNSEKSGAEDIDETLALTLTLPDSSDIIGGLWGHTGWNYLCIELLFVPEPARGTGTGRELMRQAEAEAIRRGCHHVWLDTFSFQALGFYQRLGYATFGTLEAYPPGHSRYFLQKQLA